jgi:hypothetical protein
MINALLANYKDMKFPKEIFNPPKNWVLEKTFGERENKLLVYYVT